MKKKQIYFFVGTPAEYIKIAPVIRELRKRKINFKIITSGQSKILFDELKDFTGNIKADIAFNIKAYKLSIPHFILWTIRTFVACLNSLQKEFSGVDKSSSYLIVHGDTVSSLMGTFIAKIYRMRLVHIESGLRSFNFLEPFPEEINRFLISHLADIRFCQNKSALDNVKNLRGININTKQNTLIESFWWAVRRKTEMNFFKKFKKYYVLYVRRQDHIFFKKEWLVKILEFVVTNANKKINCIFVLHPLASVFLSPEKNANLYYLLGKRLFLFSTLPYTDFIKVINNAEFAVTDGCTNQEEVYYMGLPFLALRNRTERTEGLGKNVVISKGNKNIIRSFLKSYKKYRRNPVVVKERPSKIIVDYLTIH